MQLNKKKIDCHKRSRHIFQNLTRVNQNIYLIKRGQKCTPLYFLSRPYSINRKIVKTKRWSRSVEPISNSFFRYVECECHTKQDPFSQNTGRICDQGSKVLGIGGQLNGPQIFRNSPNFKVFFNHDMILISMIYIIRSRFF